MAGGLRWLPRRYALVEDSDIVIENFRPGVAERLAINYSTLYEYNSQLIYASISGFGLSGPYSQRPGYDIIAQAMAGVMSVTGEPGRAPVKAGLPVADLSAGLFTAIGILAAVIERRETGEGQQVETSLFESALALSVWESVEYWATGEAPQPLGSAHRMSAPYQALSTKDGYITVGANNQRLWRRFCTALGEDSLADDRRFKYNSDRLQNIDTLVDVLEFRLASKTTAEWVDILLDSGVPAGPIQNYKEILENDAHVKERGMITSFSHPSAGDISVLASPIRLDKTPASVYRHAPLLGEHTEEILGKLRAGPA